MRKNPLTLVALLLALLLFPATALAQVPVVDAGPDQTIYLGDSAALHGTATGDPISWQWEVISAPTGSNYTLLGADSLLLAVEGSMVE